MKVEIVLLIAFGFSYNSASLLPQQISVSPAEVKTFSNENLINNGEGTYSLVVKRPHSLYISCDFSGLTRNEDACTNLKITVIDGMTRSEVCGNKRVLSYISKESAVKLEAKWTGTATFNCNVRAAVVQNIALSSQRNEYRLNNTEGNTALVCQKVYLDAGEKAKLSMQCDIKFSSPCREDTITINDGFTEKTYCGTKKLVVFSKESTIEVLVQTGLGSGEFSCKVQRVAQTNPNEMGNFISTPSAEDAGEGNGKKTTTCACGMRNRNKDRIHYGTETKEGEFPWMVGIRHFRGHNRCGGTIITEWHILTAAHCMTNSTLRDRNKITPTAVHIGYTRVSQAASHGQSKRYEVKETHIPNEWWDRKTGYDIAILVLKKKIEFSKFVSPICLTSVALDVTNRQALATGWGATEKWGNSQALLSTHLFPLPKSECGNSDVVICAFNKGTSICHGDSGGPLAFLDPETNYYTQIGVASYVTSGRCDKGSGWANVTLHFNYIRDVVQRTVPSAEICTKLD